MLTFLVTEEKDQGKSLDTFLERGGKYVIQIYRKKDTCFNFLKKLKPKT